jgi:hypothetical protein
MRAVAVAQVKAMQEVRQVVLVVAGDTAKLVVLV